MRVYGTSPLFNYAELLFRCRRMFIVAIIIGTAITAFVVQTRATNYEVTFVVALTGSPEIANIMQPTNAQDTSVSPARRKAGRLNFWITSIPDFLQAVVKNSGLDKRFPDRSVDDISKEIRKKLSPPELAQDQYMIVRMNWNNAEQGEAIASALFHRFEEMTIAEESAKTGRMAEALKKQFEVADTAWVEAAQKRVAYKRDHFWTQTSMLGALQGSVDNARKELDNSKLDRNEAQVRMGDVINQLKTTPKSIDSGSQQNVVTEDPSAMAKEELKGFQSQLKDLLTTYPPAHPKVQEMQKRVSAKTKEVEELSKQKTVEKPIGGTRTTMANAAFADLTAQKLDLERTVHGLDRRITDLNKLINGATIRLQGLPMEEVRSAAVEREFENADAKKRLIQNELTNAMLTYEREKVMKAQEVKLQVAPKAERMDSGSKVMALYAVGPIMGIFLAFIFSLGAEALDHTMRTPTEVEKFLGKPVLAVIPQMAIPKTSRKALASLQKNKSITS
ncbi:MAG: hypothetical protein ABJA67_08925 [Chthonomonadales bacterium]